MVIISYDIADDKLRRHFSKFIKRFGYRLQYSVYQIENSNKILNNIVTEIKNKYEKQFTQEDSILIFNLSANCDIVRYGYAKNDEQDLLIV